METKINIEEILRDKPQGTKLYSSAFGKCKLEEVDDKSFKISFYNSKFGFMNGGEWYLDKNGKLYDDGECVVFPSKEMRDWEKFSWNKGDILVNSSGFKLFFDKWANDDYTRFFGNVNILEDSFIYETEKYTLVSKDETLDNFGIEKPEFNDGDVLFVKCNDSAFIEIFEYSKNNGDLCDHASLDITNQILDISGKYIIRKDEITELRLATEAEKQQLFSALTKKGKRWDSEKKQIVYLKQKWTLKPFDRVITRNDDDDIWTANIFSHMDSRGEYVTIGCVGGYTYCIPYNDETAKLIGTTNNVEG